MGQGKNPLSPDEKNKKAAKAFSVMKTPFMYNIERG